MDRVQLSPFERVDDLCRALTGGGAFLVVQDPAGKPNPMTIGWGMVGVVWGMPMMTVLVRPSRFTFGLIERAPRWSVCVPLGKMEKALAYCGSHSGRDCDKLARCKLKAAPGLLPEVSVLEGCDLFYECETVHKNDVLRERLASSVRQQYYPAEDFHTLYFGKILYSYAR
ncbi:MAG TPA: flavin reductase [Elusimicrobia bacterium]|nr:flavin reductase [Elusimicrobiota bacterium]